MLGVEVVIGLGIDLYIFVSRVEAGLEVSGCRCFWMFIYLNFRLSFVSKVGGGFLFSLT